MFDYPRVIVDKPWVHGHQLGLHFFWQPKSNQSSFNLQYINMDDNNPYIMISYDLLNPKSRKHMWYFFRQSDWVFFFRAIPAIPAASTMARQASNAFRAISFVMLGALASQGLPSSRIQLLRATGQWCGCWGGSILLCIYIYISIYLYIYIVLSCVRLFFRLGQSFCGATTGQSWSKPSPACSWPLENSSCSIIVLQPCIDKV